MQNTSKLLAIGLGIAALASSAFANTLVLSEGIYSNGSKGGAYTVSGYGSDLTNEDYDSSVSNLKHSPSPSFETFCLEPNETFNPGSTYTYTIDSAAFGGGLDTHSAGAGDPISVGTAWLYSLFAQGKLPASAFDYPAPGFDYSSQHQKASDLTLQQAIWSLEDETADGAKVNKYFTKLLCDEFGSVENARVNAAPGAYGVSVLNLTSRNGKIFYQSQLYYHNVPENGATIVFLGLALVGLFGLRRKFAK